MLEQIKNAPVVSREAIPDFEDIKDMLSLYIQNHLIKRPHGQKPESDGADEERAKDDNAAAS